MNNQLLLEFLKHWLQWSVFGAIEDSYVDNMAQYKRYMGLCYASRCYSKLKGEDHYQLRVSLSIRFSRDNLDTMYPFGKNSFTYGNDNDTNYKTPNRLAWVRKTIKRLESE